MCISGICDTHHDCDLNYGDDDDENERMEEIEAALRRLSFLLEHITNPTAKAVMEDRGFHHTIQPEKKRAKRLPQHGFCVVPSAKKPALLCSFLRKSKKAMVFFSLDQSVDFFSENF